MNFSKERAKAMKKFIEIINLLNNIEKVDTNKQIIEEFKYQDCNFK